VNVVVEHLSAWTGVAASRPRAMTWELRHGDAFHPMSGLASLPDGTVDHVVADPPYSAHVDANSVRGGGTVRARIGIGVITGREVDALVEQSCRVAKAWLVFFTDFESVHLYKSALEIHGGRFVRTCAWAKPDCAPQFSGDRPAAWGEAIVVGHAQRKGRMRWNGRGKRGLYRSTICRGAERTEHPTQKPARLMREIVADFTNVGDLVVDPYAGTGTTGVACLALGRRFLGWEVEPRWADIARQRLASAAMAQAEAAS